MIDSYRGLHENAYSEWRENAADDYVQAQRRAFLDGFETAATESREWELLREWIAARRDEAQERYDGHGERDEIARRTAFIEVLTKLSEVGVRPDEGAGDESLLTYNPTVDRKGYFCDICGHEANDADGLKQYRPRTDGGVLNVCLNECLGDSRE